MPTGPAVLAEDGAGVAEGGVGGRGGERGGGRAVGPPLRPARVGGVAAEAAGLRGSVRPVQVDLQRPVQPVASHHLAAGRHAGHLGQEAAETRRRRRRARRRRGGDPVRRGRDVEAGRVLGAPPLAVARLRGSRAAVGAGEGIGLPLPLATEVSVVEHLFAVRVEGPVVALACWRESVRRRVRFD